MFEKLSELNQRFGDELQLHFEFTRFDGVVSPVGIPIVRYTSNERLEEIIGILETEIGLPVFNPHRVTLEEGGHEEDQPGHNSPSRSRPTPRACSIQAR